jgi:hypothetical protein
VRSLRQQQLRDAYEYGSPEDEDFEERVQRARQRAHLVWPEYVDLGREYVEEGFWGSPVEVREAGGRYFLFVHTAYGWQIWDVFEGKGALRRAVSRARRTHAQLKPRPRPRRDRSRRRLRAISRWSA